MESFFFINYHHWAFIAVENANMRTTKPVPRQERSVDKEYVNYVPNAMNLLQTVLQNQNREYIFIRQ